MSSSLSIQRKCNLFIQNIELHLADFERLIAAVAKRKFSPDEKTLWRIRNHEICCLSFKTPSYLKTYSHFLFQETREKMSRCSTKIQEVAKKAKIFRKIEKFVERQFLKKWSKYFFPKHLTLLNDILLPILEEVPSLTTSRVAHLFLIHICRHVNQVLEKGLSLSPSLSDKGAIIKLCEDERVEILTAPFGIRVYLHSRSTLKNQHLSLIVVDEDDLVGVGTYKKIYGGFLVRLERGLGESRLKAAAHIALAKVETADLDSINESERHYSEIYLLAPSNKQLYLAPPPFIKFYFPSRSEFLLPRFSGDLWKAVEQRTLPLDWKPTTKYASFCLTDSLKVLDDVCEGLDYLHSVGQVHRDVKPPNLLLRYKDGWKGYLSDPDLMAPPGLSSTESYPYPYWPKVTECGISMPESDGYGLAMCLGDSLFSTAFRPFRDQRLSFFEEEYNDMLQNFLYFHIVTTLEKTLPVLARQIERSSTSFFTTLSKLIDSIQAPADKRRLCDLLAQISVYEQAHRLIYSCVEQDLLMFQWFQEDLALQEILLSSQSVEAKNEAARRFIAKTRARLVSNGGENVLSIGYLQQQIKELRLILEPYLEATLCN